jgi:hypothetical protein
MFSFLPSLIEVSRAAWRGVPLEMKEGIIPVGGTKGLSTRPRCSYPNKLNSTQPYTTLHYTAWYHTLRTAYLDEIFSYHRESRPLCVYILHIHKKNKELTTVVAEYYTF